MGTISFRWLRLLLVPFLGVLFYFCMLIISSYNLQDEYYRVSWQEHLTAIVYCVFFITLLSEGSIFISKLLDRWLDWNKYSVYRFIVQISLQAVFSVLTFTILWAVFEHQLDYEYTGSEFDSLNELETRQVMVMSTATTLLVTAVYTGMIFFQKWKKSLLESERFKRESVQAQFDVLKNQVDPHFLFNTLNTLTTVIAEDQTLAIRFVEHLSQVYRYVLQMKDRKTVALSTELDFVHAYVFLLNMRFGENLQIMFNLPDCCYSLEIAPLTLQLLVENATKHNIISAEKPLRVTIAVVQDGWLTVSNNLQPRMSMGRSTQVGLQHLLSRYKLLTETAPMVETTATEFIVKLPLLSPEVVSTSFKENKFLILGHESLAIKTKDRRSDT